LGLTADEQASTDGILSFMFDDLSQVPADVAMRAPQVANLIAEIPYSGKVVFSWNDQDYVAPVNWLNAADGYRVYKEDGGWQLLAQLPYGTRTYTHEEANVAGLYQVSAYAAFAGNSALPKEEDVSVTAVPALARQGKRITGIYPNPFNPSTTIDYTLDQTSDVRIEVFSPRGRLVRILVAERRDPGDYSTRWDGRDMSGKTVASGQYYCQMTADRKHDARKLILLK